MENSTISLRPRCTTLAALVMLGAACGGATSSDGSGPRPPAAASVLVVSGDRQVGTVGKELAEALVVRVLDAAGNPVASQLVTFHVKAGGGSLFAGASLTGADGQASDRWTLGTRAVDAQAVEARAVDNATGQAVVFATFTATAVADAPATLAPVSGNDQIAVVDHELAARCVVRVTDRYGNPVPGEAISWTAVAGGGSPTPASTSTNADGLASTSWTLGPVEGSQSLKASRGFLSAVFRATGLSAAPTSITRVAGDAQVGSPGAALAVAPEVVVKDVAGNPVVRTRVDFAVTQGGGSVQQVTATTDEAGRASCGTWTLGPSKGLNAVTASVDGLPPVTFGAQARVTSPDVTVSVRAPTASQIAGDAITVAASVTSTYQLASVTASIGGAATPLTFGTYWCSRISQCPAWVGTISLAGQPRGTVGIVVTATDVFGNATDAIATATHDQAPAVAVQPLDGTVARPVIDLVATCADDDPAGCRSLTATVNGATVATGTGTISGTVDLSAHEGKTVSLVVAGVDSLGQATTVTRTIHVESSPSLVLVAEVDGVVQDADGSRVLHVAERSDQPVLEIRDTAAGVTEVVRDGFADGYGFLNPAGAMYVEPMSPNVYPYHHLVEWRAGATIDLGGVNSSMSLEVRGAYAIYSAAHAASAGALPVLTWRDLATGTSVVVASDANNWRNGVASNGDVVYSTTGSQGSNIRRWRSGVTTPLTADGGATLINAAPVTDGVNVAYWKMQPGATLPYRIAVHDGVSETVLTTGSSQEPAQGTGYAVAGGHVAYQAQDVAACLQVWRWNAGRSEQLTFFGTSSTISAIGPDGTVLLTNGGKRYRARPGAALEPIGSALGKVVVRDGRFLVLLGRGVFEVGG